MITKYSGAVIDKATREGLEGLRVEAADDEGLSDELVSCAWTNEAGRSRVFYTSLGAPEDFQTAAFRKVRFQCPLVIGNVLFRKRISSSRVRSFPSHRAWRRASKILLYTGPGL